MTGVTAIMAGISGGAAPLGVTASDVFGFRSAPDTVISNTPGTTVTGGVTPYTYLWAYQSGSTAIQVSNQTAQNPTWSLFFGSAGSAAAVWRVTVTDAASNTATADINVSLEAF